MNKSMTIQQAVWELDSVASSRCVDEDARNAAHWASTILTTARAELECDWKAPCFELYSKLTNVNYIKG